MVRDADLILVMDAGQIVAQGTHEALLEESQLYVDILGSQLAPAEATVLTFEDAESLTAVPIEPDGHEPVTTTTGRPTERTS